MDSATHKTQVPGKLWKKTSREIELIDGVRQVFIACMEKLNTEELTQRLGLLPSGVEGLAFREWTSDLALRVADALDIHVEFKINGESR